MGCKDFDDEEVVANIVLQSLSENIKLYSATLAEQKETFVRDPSSITLTSLEETFFGMDNNAAVRFKSRPKSRDGSRGETANLSQQSGNKFKQKKPKKKDTKDVICFYCKKPGHYASKCPERFGKNGSNKKVSFESAHVTQEGGERAKMARVVETEKPVGSKPEASRKLS